MIGAEAFKDVREMSGGRFENSQLGRQAEGMTGYRDMEAYDAPLMLKSGSELLLDAQFSPDTLADRAVCEEDAVQIKKLCEDISDRASDDREIEPQGGLLPRYQRLMEEKGYESEEEMCNAECLNWDDIYDDEPSTYAEEYRKGFIDCIDKNRDPYAVDEEEYNEAYCQGLADAQALRDITGRSQEH